MADPIAHKQPLLPLVAFLVLLIVATLTLFAMLFNQPAMETDLLQRTRQALSEAGLPSDSVRFKGRDGILIGTVADENTANQLIDITRRVYGVRTVNNHLIVANTPAEQSEDASSPPPPAGKGFHKPSKQYPIEQIDLSALQFDYARAELNSDAPAVLDKVVAELQKNPQMKIEVSAHTDDNGTPLGNFAVTRARAEAIRNYLLSKGVKPEQVKARGYGSTRPVADNKTEQGREANRRIEITVLEE